MKRVHLHWTAGADGLNAAEADAYHFIIGRDGKVYEGQDAPEANLSPIRGSYAAHTLNANSDAIGVSLDAMAGAVERPFDAGRYPITDTQLAAMSRLVAGLCRKYGIPVTRETVLSHAEVQPTLGIPQRAKWDITWLPGMSAPGDAISVGDTLRAMIRAELDAIETAPLPPLVYGSRDPRNREVQAILKGLGLYAMTLDDIFGPGQQAALEALADRHGEIQSLMNGG